MTDAPLVVAVGDRAESTLDRLVELLWTIQSARPGVQRLADRLATVFVPLVVVVATAAAGWALLSGAGPTAALLVGLTVLIVSCPCALGLATPLAIASGIGAAARRGVVVAAEAVFEEAPDADVIVLDKTGTLTDGSMSVEAVHGPNPEEVLRRAGAVERFSEHPIAEAVVEHAIRTGAADASEGDGGGVAADGGSATAGDDSAVDGGEVERTGPDGAVDPNDFDPDDFDRFRRGVAATVDGDRVVVGHPDLLRDRGFAIGATLEERIAGARADGAVPVAVGWDGRARGVIVVGDRPREGWREAVERLSEGREVVVLTGDEGAGADRFRSVDAVSEVFAGVPPEGKAETVRRLRARGSVAMVGDGSNDAPALAAADLGVAFGERTELAIDAADAVVVSEDLGAVADAFEIAACTERRIRQNLAWAFCYNAVAIPLAVTGLLNPLFAAVAMAASSTLVVVNSAQPLGGDRDPNR